MKAFEFVLELSQGAQHFVAVLLENFDPHGGVASGDSGGIAQAAAGVISPSDCFLGEKAAQSRRERLRQMADMGDDFVVLVGTQRGHVASQSMPKPDDSIKRGGSGIVERGHETNASFKKRFYAIFPAGLLAARHRMSAHERGMRGHCGMAEPTEFTFDATHIGDDRAFGQMRSDLLGEADDFVYRRGEHRERRLPNGLLGGIAHGIAPDLFT